ncbi:glycosyltransferase [Clostridium sp. ZBS15]|uniref:glycosyltransferase n=1 Tax=Clostridium sp. ZBS15 TaxID=2949969 RepID=UPI00207A24E7|nr:glycosyltransferase [Clostridium sp. ZBS15]
MSIVHCPLSIENMVKEDNCNLNKININDTLPLVSILLAVYKPNKKWFIEQLISLNNQSYKKLELIIYDDCPEFPVDKELFKKYITNFSYMLVRSNENKGSNKAFEYLTQLGKGKFFAYCDQDDIWEENKIEILVDLILSDKCVLAYSDMRVINSEGMILFDTLIEAKPRLKYVNGENLLSQLFFKNCISGCSMIIDSKIAKKAIPFSTYMIHDHWLSVIASYYGGISFTKKTLVKYRIHDNNQTRSLSGIKNKEDYYNLRVRTLEYRLNELKKCINVQSIDLKDIEDLCYSRINKNIFKIIKNRNLCKKEAYFEVVIKYMPNWLFERILNKLKY